MVGRIGMPCNERIRLCFRVWFKLFGLGKVRKHTWVEHEELNKKQEIIKYNN